MSTKINNGRRSITPSVKTPCGSLFSILIGDPTTDILLKMGSQGDCTSAFMAGLASVISTSLNHGVSAAAFIKPLMATTCPKHNSDHTKIEVVDGDVFEVTEKLPCCIAALGEVLRDYLGGTEPYVEVPEETEAKGRHIPSGCGRLNIFVSSFNGKPVILSADVAAPGSCAAAITATLSRCISIALLNGVPAESLGKGLSGIGCHQPTHKCKSCVDGIGSFLCGKEV